MRAGRALTLKGLGSSIRGDSASRPGADWRHRDHSRFGPVTAGHRTRTSGQSSFRISRRKPRTQASRHTKYQAVEGNPLQLVANEATAHDLVALGRNSIFDVEGELYDLPLSVERIVRDEPRPILLVPSEENGSGATISDDPLLVAFDGSPAASRALHMFALLGLAQGRTVHVITVGDASDSATDTARQACKLLDRHGAAGSRPIGLGDREAGTPSETILGLAKSIGAGMIVMGAYGRRGIREIFGSTTREILYACPPCSSSTISCVIRGAGILTGVREPQHKILRQPTLGRRKEQQPQGLKPAIGRLES